jgi:hypothetical protein
MYNELDYEISDKLDEYQGAIDRRVCAEIDAGSCGTSRDWDRAHETQEREENLREELDALIQRKVKEAYEFGQRVGRKAA